VNIQKTGSYHGIALVASLALLSACAAPMTVPDGIDDTRGKLIQLQSDSELATRAPVEVQAAEAAVAAAEMPRQDRAYADHLALIADHRVDIARARARGRLYEDQRRALSERSERVRLEARTLEADQARSEALSARADADSARVAADTARSDAEAAREAARELQRQVAELNARETDRGLVVTLGDLLFATGRSELAGSAVPNLNRLAAFLAEYPDRSVLIEGHTDSVGSAWSNELLSERRAESVRSYLVDRGVAANRLSTSGKGEGTPVATNDTPTGRQQNRRVEVIISSASSPGSGTDR